MKPGAHAFPWRLLLLLAVLWLATGLRFHRLDAQSFWNDEGNSARLSERAIPLILAGTASDVHPPLYYLILRGWRELLGAREFGLRAFSAFSGVLTVAAVLALTKLLAWEEKNAERNAELRGGDAEDRREEIKKSPRNSAPSLRSSAFLFLPSLLVAVSPALVYYSQETRMYALLGLLSVLSTAVLLRWLRAANGRRWALGYALLATAGLYTHYFFPAVLLVHGLIVLGGLLRDAAALLFQPPAPAGKRPLLRTALAWTGLLALALLLYLPWLPIFLRQIGGGVAPRPPLLAFLHDSLRWLLLGETAPAGALAWAAPAALALLLVGLAVGRGRALIPLVGAAVPALFAFAAGATAPQFQKFLVTAVPFLAIGLAGGAWWATRRDWLRAAWLALLLVLIGAMGLSLRNLYADPAFARADYRGMAARIAADAHPNAGVILNAPNQWEVFTYYHREGAPVYPLPRGWPDPAVLEPELAAIAARHDRLYAIFWGDAQRDPERLVERWLDAHAFKASETWVRDVRFVVYAVPGEPVTEMATAAGVDGRGARFGNVITLRGYTLGATTLRPGDVVQVTLFWETAVALDARYKVFLHLLDAAGQPAAQRDSEPGGGLALTTTWRPGVVVVDNHGVLLPIDLPPGDYPLVVGLYDFADPTRRLAVQVNGAEADRFELGMVTVR